jgi:ribosomal protein S1
VTDQPLTTGDLIDAVVTQVSPFGVHVESVSGIPGLVTGSDAAEGTVLHLRVVSFDAELQRFAGELA